jgi:hypothetical protein
VTRYKPKGWEPEPGIHLIKYPSRLGIAALAAETKEGAVAVALP